MKKIYKYIAIVVVAITGDFTYNLKNNKASIISNITVENIEALANGESGSSACYATICYKECHKDGKKYIYESESECYCSLCKGD